ncbi:MAG: ATP-binding cassette domain-containing protein, partial [Oscillospiraceae bacterium]
GVPPLEIRERVDKALKDVDMYDYRLNAPHQLSGGQKQRIAIAGIIAMRPKIIILDEPTAMLDPRGRREVMDIIIKLNREFKV